MNTETVFRYQWKFYKLNKCFRGKVKSTMISAWNDYVNEWRDTYYWRPPKWVWTRFRDDFRYLKQLIWNQTVYLMWSWVLYNRDANTCELRIAYSLYSINDEWLIDWIWTSGKWSFSSSMFDLEPIGELPRRIWWTIIPGEKYDDVGHCCWRDADVFIALGWEQAKWLWWHRWRMYWTWNSYSNWYDDGYQYFNGKAYQAKRSMDWQKILYNWERVPFKQLQESHTQEPEFEPEPIEW